MIPIQLIWYVFWVLMGIVVLLMGAVTQQKRAHRKAQKRRLAVQETVFERYIEGHPVQVRFKPWEIFESYVHLCEQVHISEEAKTRFLKDVTPFHWMRYLNRQVRSWRSFNRQRAAIYLGYFELDEAYALLRERLQKERHEVVFFYLVNALKSRLDAEVLTLILTKLPTFSESMIQRLTTLLLNQKLDIEPVFESLKEATHPQIILFFITYTRRHPSSTLLSYVRTQFTHFDTLYQNSIDPLHHTVRLRSARVLEYLNDDVLHEARYLAHKDPELLALIYRVHLHRQDAVAFYASQAEHTTHTKVLIEALETLFRRDKTTLDEALVLLESSKLSASENHLLTLAMGSQLETILFRTLSSPQGTLFTVLMTLLKEKRYTPFIRFLNHNKNPRYEFELTNFLKGVLDQSQGLAEELSLYAKDSVLQALNLTRQQPQKRVPHTPEKERDKLCYLRRFGLFALVLFPVIFTIEVITRGFEGFSLSLLGLYILRVNLYIVAYYVVVNLIYLVLIYLSHQTARNQIRRWRLKQPSLLYEDRLLPAISILAPAYNEALSIVDSVQSLLNLTYPRYEVIVINDGSTDDTLRTLVSHFDLTRHPDTTSQKLSTQPVLALYKTPKIPNLVVVDKRNGGKADALNVGINVASYDHVCGIDADSVLESDALLKMLSTVLDGQDALALGGHIHPSNGSKVVKGVLEERGLGSLPIERYQTLEYVRAFTTGRLGWAKLNSLLIISGAFGLFKKAPLIQAGGYMTRSSALKKDTVGEDMELVVRMRKEAYQRKEKHRVLYLYQAGCHTQVPDTWNALLKQRNRWHRGLIDILSYHKDMTFNPRYRGVGMLAFPYFVIFEMVGPLLEIQAYAFLFLAFVFGILTPSYFLAFFTATIGLGMVVSLYSLLLLEKEHTHFNLKDTWRLLFYAIIENFGYRQLMSLYRVRGYFSALKETHEWGEQKRRGFK